MHEELRRRDWPRFSLAAVAIAALMAGTAVPAHGQTEEEEDDTRLRWEAVAFGGTAGFGDFLEQRTPAGVERELTGSSSTIVGASIGVLTRGNRELRLTGAFAPTELELQDDDATTGSDAADVSDLGDLNVWIVGVEVSQFVTSADATVAPYLTVGLSGALWSLDAPPGSPVGPGADDDDNQIQFGGLGGGGLQFNLPDAWGVKIEARRYTLGNPFDGSDGFALEGETFEEPGTTGLTALTVAATYTF